MLFSTIGTWDRQSSAWFVGTVTEIASHDLGSVTVKVAQIFGSRVYTSTCQLYLTNMVESEAEIPGKSERATIWAILYPGESKSWEKGRVMDMYLVS